MNNMIHQLLSHRLYIAVPTLTVTVTGHLLFQRTKEAFKRELYCLLKTGSNPLTPIGEEPDEKGPKSATSDSHRLSPEGASSHDNDVEQEYGSFTLRFNWNNACTIIY